MEKVRQPDLDRRLALLLHYGTIAGSLVIAAGLVLAWAAPFAVGSTNIGEIAVNFGVAFFLSLPVIRVVLMLGVFLCDRDYPYAAITMAVLAVILSGAILGVCLGRHAG